MNADDNTMVAERELLDALEPLRPDSDAFRSGVEERIAARGHRGPHIAPGEEAGGLTALLAPLLRGAASVLPPTVIPTAAIPTAAAMTAKKTGAKAIAAYLTMPVVLLAVFGWALVQGVRSLRRLDGRTDPGAEQARGEIQAWWREHRALAFGGMALWGALLATSLWRGSADWLIAYFVFAVIALTGIVLRLSDAGIASRRSVGGAAANLLWMVGMLGFVFDDRPGFLYVDAATTVLWVGAIICWTVGGRGAPATLPPSRPTEVGWLGKSLIIAILAAPAGAVILHQLRTLTPGIGSSEIRSVVEHDVVGYPPDGYRLAAWAADLQLEVSRDHLIAAITRDLRSMGSAAPGVVTAVHRGWLAREQLRAFRGDATTERRWLGTDGVITPADLELGSLIALVCATDLSEAQRDVLAARLVGAIPEPLEFEALSGTVRICRYLDLLGRGDQISSLRNEIRDMLARHWKGEGFRPGEYGQRAFDYVSPSATSAGIQLMRRVGVPEAVDVRSLREYATLQGRPIFLFARRDIGQREWAVAVAQIDRELAPRSWWDALFDARVLLAALLVVALGLYATLRAPVPSSAVRESSQPFAST